MLTKRMMLGAGALALALAVAACSEDRAGGATGVSGVPGGTALPAPAPPPGGLAVAAEEDSIRRPPPRGDDGISFATNGHQYSILVVTGASGGDVTRIVQDGATLMEIGGTPASLATATAANVSLYHEGQAVFNDVVSLQSTAVTTLLTQFRLVPGVPGGPQLQKAMPCAAELAGFGAAAAYLSWELFLARVVPGSVSPYDIGKAAGAVVVTGYLLYVCLAANWG
jgi:hypothetical protein